MALASSRLRCGVLLKRIPKSVKRFSGKMRIDAYDLERLAL